MKPQSCLTLGWLLVATAATALDTQPEAPSASRPLVKKSIKHDLSPPLALMKSPPPRPGKARERINRVPDLASRFQGPALAEDPLLHEQAGPEIQAPMPAPIITFEGTSDDDNAAIVGFRVVPPDTNGDIGPNHYVQWNNLVFAVYDKNTGQIAPGFPKAGNALFAGFGGPCDTTNDGDPIALYDQFADRWVLSQFAIDDGIQCVAVSKTPDPTGAYYRYAFEVSPGWNDYPKLGVWPDGYYLTFNEFTSSFTQVKVAALERAKMLAGKSAQMVVFGVVAPAGIGCTGAGDCYFSLQPPHVEGTTPPQVGAPAPFGMVFDDEVWRFGGNSDWNKDFYKLWKFAVNWANPASSTFTGPVSVPTPEFDAELCSFWECVPQKGTTRLLDTLSQFTMYRMVYRRFAGHESLLFSHTVDVGSNRAGVRFGEVRDPGGTPILYQSGTHAPADGEHRWMPSAAMDRDGNIAIGYSVSSANTFPSIRYVGRLASDPLGTLPQTETVMLAGTGSQTGHYRWGDYSAMSIDESDDCTFWYTTEYYQTTGSFDFNTRIGAFRFASCTAGPRGTLTGTVTASGSGSPLPGALIQGGNLLTTTDAAGVYAFTLPVGTHDVTASLFGYQPQTVSGVVISQNQTTAQDFSLNPLPRVTVDGFVTDGSGAGWPLYARIEIAAQGGPTQTVFTDPNTGYYSTSLVGNTPYTFTVIPLVAGYLPAGRPVITSGSDERQDFALLVDASACNAPGYSPVATQLLGEAFARGIPASWTVTNTTTRCDGAGAVGEWSALDPGTRGNRTGGTGSFAIIDSDRCGPTARVSTDLVTPELDLSSLGPNQLLQISFNSDYFDECEARVGSEVSLDVWNGAAWTRVFDFCGASRRGPRVESFTTTAANGVAGARVRWRYRSEWDWWWEVDNVSLSVADCVFQGGGLILGNVYDANTSLGLNGATVMLDSGQTATTAATPNDLGLDDGFYLLHVPGTAQRTMTVSKARYVTQQRQVMPNSKGSRREDFQLPAGRLAASPQQLRARLPIGGNVNTTLTLTNTGSLDATFRLLEIDAPADLSAPQAPFHEAPATPSDSEGAVDDDSPTARHLPPGAEVQAPILLNAGEWVRDFATGLPLPWGVGYNVDAGDLWVSDSAGDKDHRFLADGTPTTDTIDTSVFGGSWAADMTFNNRTGMLWQVNVGGDNCLKELDPVARTATGNSLCPSFGTSLRGVAFNPLKGTFFVGSWNQGGLLAEVASDGTILRQWTAGLNVSGLAFNPTTGHLFTQVNDFVQSVRVLDVRNNFALVGLVFLRDQGGNPAFGPYEGSGLEIDCQGNLWSVNQDTGKVFVNASGETGVCLGEIPWLSESPMSGTLVPGGSAGFAVSFDAAGLAPGCREALLVVFNDTPYGDIALPAGLTVEFGDVPAGAFADAHIHAIAGAGISYGCGGGNFCPNLTMTRRTMAVWLLRAKFGGNYTPPPAVGIFQDVPPGSFAADYIEDLYNRGITSGCSANPLMYCPDNAVTRGQMSVLLLKTLLGSNYTPPACTGIFGDVACPSLFANWIEDLYNRGISQGCNANPLTYCPGASTTRAQMAILVSRTFGMPACKQ